MTKKDLILLLNEINITNTREVTIEINPDDVHRNKIREWIDAGINRFSMGCQSMDDNELKLLGRRHNAEDVVKAFQLLHKAGIDNISLDLIYGLPGQSVDSVLSSLQQIIKLDPQHISIYCLSLAENCSMYKHKNKLPADDDVEMMYYTLLQELEKNDFMQYEISNFSRLHKESRHNMAYWQQKHYLSIGPAAAGYVPGVRYQNQADIIAWSQSVLNKRFFPNKDEIDLKKEEQEFIMLSLRLRTGIDLKIFSQKFHQNFLIKYRKLLAKYQSLKLIECTKDAVKLTKKGLFVSNEIMADFI